MTETEIISREITHKNQALRDIRDEREKLKHRLALSKLKDSLEAQIGKKFDPILSRKLDCINYLLENYR